MTSEAMRMATSQDTSAGQAQWRARASRWRSDLFALVLLLLLGTTAALLAYRLPTPSRIDVGTSYANPYLTGFTGSEQNNEYTYAFSTDESEMRLPGVGAGTHLLRLRMSEWRSGVTVPTTVTLSAGRRRLGTFNLRPHTRPIIYHVLAPSDDGDLNLRWSGTVSTPVRGDPRLLGVIVDWVEARPLQTGAALGQVLNLLAIALLAYLLLRQLALRPPAALALAAAAALALAGLLATERIWWTIYTPRLSVLLLGLNVALRPLQALTRWAWRRGGVTLSPAHEVWLWRILIAAALFKIGGVIYPQIIVFDQRWHVPRTQMVLDGRLLELLVPSRVTLLGETVGLEGGHFPYSPLWYLITAPFGWIGLDLGIASNVLNAALDVSRSLLIVYIAVRMFGQQRAAVFAAGVYHLLPMPYYLLSWGNWPTQLGLWGALLLIAVVVATFERPAERTTLALLTAAALIAMLTYTVVGIVSFTMIGMLALLEWLRRRDRLGSLRARTLLGALVAAELVAFVLYHIWYVPTIFAETLPAIARAVTGQHHQPNGTPKPGLLADLMVNWGYALNHLTWAVIPLVPLGAALAWRSAQRARFLLAAWALVLVVFSLFSWAVADMIFKHIFFILPLVAICVGLLLAAFWSRRGWANRLVPIAVLLFLAEVCAERWYGYIMIKRH